MSQSTEEKITKMIDEIVQLRELKKQVKKYFEIDPKNNEDVLEMITLERMIKQLIKGDNHE
jgi:hypothetical protein